MPPRLDTLPKGHQMSPSTFELSPQWVREYTAAVEDEAIGALDGGLVPPMAVAALAVRSLLQRAELPPGAIHFGHDMAFRRPVHVGERLAVQARVASRGERQGWLLMRIDLSLEGEDHGPVMSAQATVAMPASPEGER